MERPRPGRGHHGPYAVPEALQQEERSGRARSGREGPGLRVQVGRCRGRGERRGARSRWPSGLRLPEALGLSVLTLEQQRRPGTRIRAAVGRGRAAADLRWRVRARSSLAHPHLPQLPLPPSPGLFVYVLLGSHALLCPSGPSIAA